MVGPGGDLNLSFVFVGEGGADGRGNGGDSGSGPRGNPEAMHVR